MPAGSELIGSLREVRNWCAREVFHPNRVLGQNFLIDGNTRMRIIETVACRPGMRVVEIGPGLGAITRGLLATGVELTAIEKDPRLFAALLQQFPHVPRLRLRLDDALHLDLDVLLAERFDCLVSNLPYSVGTRILMQWLRHPLSPPRVVVTVQSEVAERLAAGPGTRARGLAGVWAQRFYHVRMLRRLSPGCFWPRPAVDSVLVLMTRNAEAPPNEAENRLFESMTRYAFMHRRKQMLAAWRHAPPPLGTDAQTLRQRFAQADVPPEARPEALDGQQWRRLARVWYDAADTDPGSDDQ